MHDREPAPGSAGLVYVDDRPGTHLRQRNRGDGAVRRLQLERGAQPAARVRDPDGARPRDVRALGQILFSECREQQPLGNCALAGRAPTAVRGAQGDHQKIHLLAVIDDWPGVAEPCRRLASRTTKTDIVDHATPAAHAVEDGAQLGARLWEDGLADLFADGGRRVCRCAHLAKRGVHEHQLVRGAGDDGGCHGRTSQVAAQIRERQSKAWPRAREDDLRRRRHQLRYVRPGLHRQVLRLDRVESPGPLSTWATARYVRSCDSPAPIA